MKVGDKVRVKADGRVGNIKDGIGKTKLTITVPVEAPHPTRAGRTVAGLEDIELPKDELEFKWLEGPDEHTRFWDEQGNQVVFYPDGSTQVIS